MKDPVCTFGYMYPSLNSLYALAGRRINMLCIRGRGETLSKFPAVDNLSRLYKNNNLHIISLVTSFQAKCIINHCGRVAPLLYLTGVKGNTVVGEWRSTPFSPPGSLSMRPLATCCGASYGSSLAEVHPTAYPNQIAVARVRLGGGKCLKQGPRMIATRSRSPTT